MLRFTFHHAAFNSVARSSHGFFGGVRCNNGRPNGECTRERCEILAETAPFDGTITSIRFDLCFEPFSRRIVCDDGQTCTRLLLTPGNKTSVFCLR